MASMALYACTKPDVKVFHAGTVSLARENVNQNHKLKLSTTNLWSGVTLGIALAVIVLEC